jgi:hypothetical protein
MHIPDKRMRGVRLRSRPLTQVAVGLASPALRFPDEQCTCIVLLPLEIKTPASAGAFISGGETGIRTPVSFNPEHAFQACDLNHSSISPNLLGFSASTLGHFIVHYPGVLLKPLIQLS